MKKICKYIEEGLFEITVEDGTASVCVPFKEDEILSYSLPIMCECGSERGFETNEEGLKVCPDCGAVYTPNFLQGVSFLFNHLKTLLEKTKPAVKKSTAPKSTEKWTSFSASLVRESEKAYCLKRVSDNKEFWVPKRHAKKIREGFWSVSPWAVKQNDL